MSTFTFAWQALIVFATTLSGFRYLSRQYPEHLDVFLMFFTLTGLVIPDWTAQVVGGTPEWVSTVSAVLLLAHPYAMVRVVDHLYPVRERARQAVLAGLLGAWMVISAAPSPRAGVLTILLASYFAAAEIYAAFLLVKGSTSRVGATRKRLRFAAAGSFMLGVAVFMAFGWGIIPLEADLANDVLSGLVVAGVLSFYLGFAPPRRLTQLWDIRTLHTIIESAPKQGSLAERTDRSIERFVDAVNQLADPEAYVLAAPRDEKMEIRFEPSHLSIPEGPAGEGTLLDASMEEGQILRERDLNEVADWEKQVARQTGAQELVAIPFAQEETDVGGCVLFLREHPLFNEETALFLHLLGAEDVGQALHVEELARRHERQRLEALEREKEALEEADRLKDEFLATMSHEIRTPINAILGSADLLRYTDLSPEQEEHLETIETSGDHLLMLIGDVLNLSKIEAGEVDLNLQDVKLEPFMDSCIDLASERADVANIELGYEISPEAPEHVRVDPDRVRQILTNLVTNAIKFTPEGHVKVLVDAHDGPGEMITLGLHVEDTGVGIPEDKQDSIFEPFQQVDPSTTREHEGTGLGLAICKQLVDTMEGEIRVDSSIGEGTTIHVELPVLPSKGPSEEAPLVFPEDHPEEAPAEARPVDVLVVEDNEVNLRVAKGMLEELGYEPETARSGQEGLQKIQENSFDVVFLDLRMPVMDGFEVARRIREDFPEDEQPWLVALTAHEGQHYREKAREAGTDSYLAKPVRSQDLAKELQQVPGPREGRDAPTRSEGPGAEDATEPQREQPDELEGLQMLDASFLEEMGETMPEDTLHGILSSFLEEAPHLVDEVEKDARHGDTDALESHAHALKGVARTVGAEPLAELAHEIEDEPASARLETEQIQQLKEAWEATRDEVDEIEGRLKDAT